MKYSPKIMGILNITPDSFYDGNSNLSTENIIDKIKALELADIIDVGCESSRPGADTVDVFEEMDRLNMALDLLPTNKKPHSIDTSKYEIADYAIRNGFTIINDITAGKNDERIFELAAESNSQIVLMHMLRNPKTMQDNPKYDSLIDNILEYLDTRVDLAKFHSIKEENIIIDPGIGFGKTSSDNIVIIKNINRFKDMGYRVLLGHSRKQFLQFNDDTPKDRMPATMGVTAYAAMKEVDIVRVHDVKETKSMLNTITKLC